MDKSEKIETPKLLQEIKLVLKDFFVASVRRKGDELVLQFPNGQKFVLTVWEDNFAK